MANKKQIKQKDVWQMVIELDEKWKKPSYYNHVREVVELIEGDNDVKVPIEMIHKLDKRYKKIRDKK